MKSPAYQWYPKDILSSERVAFLSLSEEGAYRRALDYCWLRGSIPSDPAKLATLIGKKCTVKIASAVIPLFENHPTDSERLIHDKQEKYRADQEEFRRKQVENGKKGGRPKKPKETQRKPRPSDSLNPKKGLHTASASSSASTITPKESESVNTRADLSASNLYRTPNVPTLELVKAVFQRNGGTEVMAKKFFDSNEATGWYYKSSPITNFVNLVPGYIESWKSREDDESEPGKKKMVV